MASRQSVVKPKDPKPKPELFTIEDVFNIGFTPYLEGEDRQLREEGLGVERGIRSVAYLLDSVTNGDVPVDSVIASGMCRMLEFYAEGVSRLERRAQFKIQECRKGLKPAGQLLEERIRELESKAR